MPLARILFWLLVSASAFAVEPATVFERASRSVVVVIAGDESEEPKSLGSGVIISPGLAVTNCHVLAGMVIFVLKQQENLSLATVVYRDSDRDICLLESQDRSLFRVPISGIVRSDGIRVGQRVYAIGSPSGLELTFTEGLVSSVRTFRGNTVIQTSAPFSEGSSGGGLFDMEGRLLAITTFYLKDGQNLNFAYPAEYIPSRFFHASNEGERIRQPSVNVTAPPNNLVDADKETKIRKGKIESPTKRAEIGAPLEKFSAAVRSVFSVPVGTRLDLVTQITTTISQQGAIESARVTQVSGDQSFDNSALEALRTVSLWGITQSKQEQVIFTFRVQARAEWEKEKLPEENDPTTNMGFTRLCRNIILRNYIFPYEMMIRGHSGTSRVLVKIDRTGKIIGTGIIKSSGVEELDLAARQIASLTGRLPPPPPSFTGKGMELEIDIDFLLRKDEIERIRQGLFRQ